MTGVEAEIAALASLDTARLRSEWRRLHHTEPPSRLSRDLLIRAIAYKVQEKAQGGLPQAMKRKLRTLALELDAKGHEGFDPGISLKPGAKLVREWHGRTHTVIVLEDGFEYEGSRYPSLSRIAQRITGVHWSGPRFFGLVRSANGSRESEASSQSGSPS